MQEHFEKPLKRFKGTGQRQWSLRCRTPFGISGEKLQKALHEIALNICAEMGVGQPTCMMNVNWILQMKQCAESIR